MPITLFIVLDGIGLHPGVAHRVVHAPARRTVAPVHVRDDDTFVVGRKLRAALGALLPLWHAAVARFPVVTPVDNAR
eukprot:2459899-Rhodomonas_salina.1